MTEIATISNLHVINSIDGLTRQFNLGVWQSTETSATDRPSRIDRTLASQAIIREESFTETRQVEMWAFD